LELSESVMVIPPLSVAPNLELVVSQDGVLMEYFTDPVDALMRYSMRDGANGPPGGPETTTLVDGVTINAGEDCSTNVCAKPTTVKNSIAESASKPIEGLRPTTLIATW